MNPRQHSVITPSDFWETVFRHKKKLLITPALILLAATAVILFFPRTYQSEAKLFLQIGRESIGLDPSATTGQTVSLQQNGRDAEIVSAMEVITSRSVISQVVDAMGPDYILRGGPAGEGGKESIFKKLTVPLAAGIKMLKSIDPVSSREEAIIELEDNLEVDSERDSTVIVVQYDADTAKGAQEILQKLVEIYQREHLRIHRNAQSQDFFADQRSLLEKRLEAANRKVRDTKNRMGIASVEGRRMSLEQQLRSIEAETYSTEQNLATALASSADLTKQIEAMPERMIASKRSVPNEGADLLRDQLYALQMRQMDLKARYSDSHPLVMAISAQLDEAKKVVENQSESRQETTDDINPNRRQLSLELQQQQSVVAGLEARLETLQDQTKLVLQDLRELNRYEMELDDLTRQVSLARSKFFKYAENLEQARIDQELETEKISSVSVAQDATYSEKPVSPSKVLVGLGAILLAFGGTLTWVAASEQLNDNLRTDEEAEQHLGLPVFAAIPDSEIHSRVLNY